MKPKQKVICLQGSMTRCDNLGTFENNLGKDSPEELDD